LVKFYTSKFISSIINLDYINWDDGAFGWDVFDKKEYDGFDYYTMNMTSQRWLTEYDTDRPLWWHTISIAVPHKFDPEMGKAAFLAIDGGFNNKDPATSHPILPDSNYNAWAVGKIATESGAIAANIYFVPNQRIEFLNDWDDKYIGRGRAEDSIISLTWKYFIDHPPTQASNTDEPHWLLRYPMVKVSPLIYYSYFTNAIHTVGRQSNGRVERVEYSRRPG